ncbi:hypothetical protein RND81_01G048600 [Saponaria officinalis]|uniref:RING-type domain-containing protein n=1 Tax=Saponaria officinalis TaxID=3572 RepID=A0AAW1N602_SAPOF
METACNNDAGTCVSSDVPDDSVHGVEAEHAEVRAVEAGLHDQQPNTDSEERDRHCRWLPSNLFQRFQISVLSFGSSDMPKDAWSCTIVILTFWLFASIVLVLGFYGSYNLQLGPNCSYAIVANPIFANSIQTQELDDQTSGPMLYGFLNTPSLNVELVWSTTHNASIKPEFNSEWTYYLNAGSQVAIYYDIQFSSSDPLSIVIAQGRENLDNWINDPADPNSVLSWNFIYGSGNITQDITESDVYYVAVSNLNLNTVQVYLNITIQSLLYNTSNADFNCYLSNHNCSFKLKLLKPNVAVVTTPGPSQINTDNEFYIEVSFAPQWLTYCAGSCIVTALVLAMFRCCGKTQHEITYDTENQIRENAAEREPLISDKSHESSSMCSSYESTSNEEDDVEENNVKRQGLEGNITKDGGSNSKSSRLCAICFDAPKDCFFVPCGHSVACFSCGSRIAEEAGTCPICRRKMKKVRKIFLV